MSESIDKMGQRVPRKPQSNNKGRTNDYAKRTSSSGYYCAVHGKNNTHATQDCRVIKLKAAEIRAGSNGDGGKCPKYSNKTWKHTDNKDSKKEINALVAKAVCKELKNFEELKVVDRKRKVDESDIDSDDDHSINNVEEELNRINQELKEFNYENMDSILDDKKDDASFHSTEEGEEMES